MDMPSTEGHNFSKTPQANIQRSTFNRSHGGKLTFNSGDLIPIFCDEVLPGDTFNLNMSGFGRLATPILPFMDNVHLETFFFFVPNRLLWSNWEKFNGAQDDPGDSTDFLIPQVTTPVGGYLNGSLSDYFGIPTQEDIGNVNCLHHRAYNLIWNEWFRDQNMQDTQQTNIGNGPMLDTDFPIQKRGKRHDYFTSALPWPQKGDAVSLPLGTSADIHTAAAAGSNITIFSDAQSKFAEMDADTNQVDMSINNGASADKMYADLTTATAATINQLREAFRIQELYEKDARGGTRYISIIKSHFNVTSPDARLQRPEYLGGGHSMLNINPIAQTSSTDGTSPQGNLAAEARIQFSKHGFNKSFTEHGVIIGLVNVRADLNYQQGVNRMWSRQARFDYYWPALANIGEQAILNKEIFADGSAADELVFGYIPRYDEYRYKPSQICGQFRSNFAQTLDIWHLAQNFATLPVLDSTFIEENPPLDRVLAVQAPYPQFIMDTYFDLKCARPMPTFAVPGMSTQF